MRKALRLIIGCGLLGALGACGHTVALTPLDGGQPSIGGQGAAHIGAPLMIKIDGKTYRGHWRPAVASEELPTPAPDAYPAPVQVGRYYGQRGASGYGVADFKARDGSNLICRFRYERGQDHGSGLCQSDTGRSFSMTIDLGAEG